MVIGPSLYNPSHVTPDSSSPSLPTGTVTFLFSDIEGSTRLLQELGEGYPPVLEKQAELVRAVLGATGGVEVATEGDSFFAVFSSAQAAVSAAAKILRALDAHPWPDDVSVRVRMGLHTGEGLLVGDNYGGLDVHRAARIAAVAHGGQIVVSASTAALAGTSLPQGLELLGLGKHRLKDLVAEEELFQVSVSGLRTEFPPVRSLGSSPNNLPVELTNFIGREHEIDAIAELLRANRLVTMTGPGGTGKTRLSLQVAARCLGDHPDGVFFVLLAPITDPNLVPSTIATTIGVKEEKNKESGIVRTLIDYLKDRRMLLVLDNFEQIVDAAPAIADMLSAAPSIKALVTSRAILRISGEHEYSVPPMVLPDPNDLPSVELILQYETVALFVQRAAAVKTGFTLTEENAPAVVAICKRLDGLPLAIELAAARVRILTPQAISDRLVTSLGLLTGGGRDLPERQQTLQGAIDWSFDLLDETLKRFFTRLSVFVNGFTYEAVEIICNPDDELKIDTLDALTQLVDNSLIRQFETPDGAARFRLLQVIREYALEKLDGSGEADEIRNRHATHFVAMSESLERQIGHADADTLECVDREHDNLRAVLSRSIENNDAEPGIRVAAAVWRFWMIRSHLAEGRSWLDRLLELPSGQTRDRTRARGLDAAASIAYWQNDYDLVQPYYEESLAIYRELDDAAGIAAQTYNLAFTVALAYDYDTACSLLEEAREGFKALGDTDRETDAIWGWSWLSAVSGQHERALPAAEECLERYRAARNSFGIGSALFTLSRIYRHSGDLEQAWRYMLEGADVFIDARDLGNMASLLKEWAYLELLEGRTRRAAILWGAGLAIEAEYGGGAPEPIGRIPDPVPGILEKMSTGEFEELMADGAALTYEEAVAFAKKQSD